MYQDNNIVTKHPGNINCIAINKNIQAMKASSTRHKKLKVTIATNDVLKDSTELFL